MTMPLNQSELWAVWNDEDDIKVEFYKKFVCVCARAPSDTHPLVF